MSDNFIPEDFKHQIKMELGEILTALGVDVERENFNQIHRVPDLWAEYMFGIGGRKPASQITRLERQIQAKVFLSERDLANSAEDGEQRLDL